VRGNVALLPITAVACPLSPSAASQCELWGRDAFQALVTWIEPTLLGFVNEENFWGVVLGFEQCVFGDGCVGFEQVSKVVVDKG
jgi:hypothetical protein